MIPIPIPVLVLAAGTASRFGTDKLLAEVAGQPLLAWTLEGIFDAVPTDHVLVVLGPRQDERAGLCEAAGATTTIALEAERGMGWSLHAGLVACPDDVPGAIVLLADDPLTTNALPGILATARRTPGRAAAMRRDPFVPHPVYLPRSAWPDSPARDEDRGLSSLLDDHCTWIEDSDPAPIDVDVPDDIELLATRLRHG